MSQAQHRILITDDSPDALRLLAQILETHGHQVLQAPNGKVALQIAKRALPDLIILDIQMPEMGGFETCEQLKKTETLRDIPIIFVSGLGETLDKVKAFQLGGVDYITKPYQEDELLARVRTHLRLRDLTEHLEFVVQERTQELAQTNQQLYQEIIERKHAQGQLQRQVQRLAALRNIDTAITTTLDLSIILKVLLNEAITQLAVDAADILLFDSASQILKYEQGLGFYSGNRQQGPIQLGMTGIGQAVIEQKVIKAKGEKLVNFIQKELISENFQFYCAAPLIAKGQIKGVLEIFHRNPLNPNAGWLDFLETLAGQAAIAIESAELFNNLQRTNLELVLAYDITLEGWAKALELRDPATKDHSSHVIDWTLKLARKLGIAEEDTAHIYRGALLHDIGKMGIPDYIQLKPGKLSAEEWEIMKQHPVYAHEMLSAIGYLQRALDIPYCHHEKWDGSGYPRGLKGEQIPLAARIFAVVDVWDALCSDRPYRKAWPREKILAYIQEHKGVSFDPRVVDAFVALIENEN